MLCFSGFELYSLWVPLCIFCPATVNGDREHLPCIMRKLISLCLKERLRNMKTLGNTQLILACSRRSHSGEQCEVKRSAKNKNEKGGGVREALPSPPLLFIAFFTSHPSPLSERLEQAKLIFTAGGTAKKRLADVPRSPLARCLI